MNATIIAVSSDKAAKQAEFHSHIGAPFGFVSDPKAELIAKYGVKTPLVKFAKRTTFVIGKARKVLHVDTGGSAINPDGSAAACKLW